MFGLHHLFRAQPTRRVFLLQLFATALILGWLPGNGLKLAAMFLVWAVGFRRISAREAWMLLGVNLTLWGGVGLFTRRLLLPLVQPVRPATGA
jgi:hypothetical protein